MTSHILSLSFSLSLTNTLTHSLTLTLILTLTRLLVHSLIHSLTHLLTHSHSLSHTHTHTHSLPISLTSLPTRWMHHRGYRHDLDNQNELTCGNGRSVARARRLIGHDWGSTMRDILFSLFPLFSSMLFLPRFLSFSLTCCCCCCWWLLLLFLLLLLFKFTRRGW